MNQINRRCNTRGLASESHWAACFALRQGRRITVVQRRDGAL